MFLYLLKKNHLYIEIVNNDFDLVSGRYVIDAKSIMGIFSLDLTQPVDMLIHSDNADELIKDIDAFIVK